MPRIYMYASFAYKNVTLPKRIKCMSRGDCSDPGASTSRNREVRSCVFGYEVLASICLSVNISNYIYLCPSIPTY